MTNLLLLIGVLMPNGTSTAPVQPTAQIESQISAKPAAKPLAHLAKGMTVKEVVAALGKPQQVSDTTAFYGGQVLLYFHTPGVCIYEDWACDITFDENGKVLTFSKINADLIL